MKDGAFTADRLLALYDRVAEAEDAIPRLRRFVLDLAVRGKLVEQDPSDEPAEELLKRIAKEKARLVKAGEIRKPKPFDPVDDPPFDVPATWQWARMRQVTTDRGQMIPDRRFTYIDVSAINKEAGVIEAPTVLEPTEAPSRARKIVCKDDVIYSCVRPYLLNVAVVEEEIDPAPIASTAFAIINGLGLIVPRYIWIVLRSPFMVSCVEETQRGQAYPAINDADFAVLPFPLPPLAEQQRIVAKVDDLMALCDQLEQARAGREAVRDRLTAATWARLTAPETGAETFPTHARAALQTLPTLTTRPDQIKTLRQTILNLAVRGKLVEQDPTDEPAAELLKRIALEKAYRRVTGEKRKEPELKRFDNPEVPFALPSGWLWVPMGELGETNVGLTYSPNDVAEVGTPVLRSSNIQNGKLDFEDLVRVRNQPKESAMVESGDLLICARNGSRALVGKVAIIENLPEPSAFGAFMAIFRSEVNRYLYIFISSPVFRSVIDEVNTTTINQITQNNLRSTLAPLPPLAEQHRIVAKVDTLMALCDQLEASLAFLKPCCTRHWAVKPRLPHDRAARVQRLLRRKLPSGERWHLGHGLGRALCPGKRSPLDCRSDPRPEGAARAQPDDGSQVDQGFPGQGRFLSGAG